MKSSPAKGVRSQPPAMSNWGSTRSAIASCNVGTGHYSKECSLRKPPPEATGSNSVVFGEEAAPVLDVAAEMEFERLQAMYHQDEAGPEIGFTRI